MEKISENDRQEIFNKFYSFGTKNEQDAYLQALIGIVPVQRKRPRNNDNSKPHESYYIYSITCSSFRHQVCKTAFMNLHGIGKDRVYRLCLLLKEGKSPQDKRGKQNPGNSKPLSLIQLIESHIREFPVKIAHYTSREYHYLSETLDIKKMHSLFVQKHPNAGVKYSLYYKIFKERFSLSFGRPQVDTCCKCEELNMKIKSKELNDNAKRVAVAEKLVHLRRAKKFFTKMTELKEKYKDDPTVAIIAVDYMQNIFLPQVPVQETFYLHQLTVSNFNINNLKTGKGVFYLYHEGMGRKGPNEVCSFITNFIQTYVSQEVKHLHVFMDGCPGQNKNHCTVRMCAGMVELGRFSTINQYFPIRGHSFMPCDRNFAVVKRHIKKHDRIYTLKHYAELIIQASQRNLFTVHIIDNDNSIIKDFKAWWPKYYKRNCVSNDLERKDRVPFNISSYMQFTYGENFKGSVKVFDFINGLVFHVFALGTRYPRPRELPGLPAYPNVKIPIKKKKMDNIKKFNTYLPDDEKIRRFYEEIFGWPTEEGEMEPEVL